MKLRVLVLFLASPLLMTCQPFEDFNNPVDPKAGNYQGYDTVLSTDDLTVLFPAVNGTFDGVIIRLTQVIGALNYEVAIATSEAGLASATALSFASNEMDASAAELADHTAYWLKARAKDSDGNWGVWTAALSFTTNYPATATPTFSPAGGEYARDQSVMISDTTTGASIYYTTDGTTPTTNSTRYTTQISALTNTSMTIIAVAIAPLHSLSAVGMATYYKLYSIGETGPAGGIVFYDKGAVSDGWRYLESAPNDQSTSINLMGNGSPPPISTGVKIGTGKANTDAIIAAQGSGIYPASLCKNLSSGGFSDWFLPSKDELNLMNTNLKRAGLGGFSDSWYWSSSQNNGSYAWGQGFPIGSQSDSYPGSNGSVRACRSF